MNRQWVSAVPFSLLMLALVVSPLVLGGNRVWVHGLLAGILLVAGFITVAVWGLGWLGEVHLEKSTQGFLFTLLAIALLFEAQAIDIVGWSVYPAATLQHANLTWAYLLYCILFVVLVNTRQRVRIVLWVLVVCGFFQSTLGIALFANNAQYTLHGEFIEHTVAKGSFVNRNHFAAYLNLCLGAGLALMLYQIAEMKAAGGVGFKRFIRGVGMFLLSNKAPLRIMLMVMVIGLIASRSRAGNGLFFAGTLVLSVCSLWVFKKASSQSSRAIKVLFVSVLAFDVLVLGALVGVDKVVERIENTRVLETRTNTKTNEPIANVLPEGQAEASEETVRDRVAPATEAFAAILEKPFLGWGGKTFPYVYTQYETENSVQAYYEHAHNDAIELLVEVGVFGTILFAFLLALPIYTAASVIVDSNRRVKTRALHLGILFGVGLVAAHTMVDFPLQIAGVVLSFLTLLLCLLSANRL